ncbi:unnamed protein product [Citrullus colocynthis]|uniref:Uncharacterized protein n=1 Tax=Citrullus colocynthis TaxID=252529 RepID=A0ABP0Z3Q9_9ROSI
MLSSNSIKEHTAFLWFLPINLQPLKFKGFKVGYPNGKCTLLNKIHMDKRVYIRSFLYPFLYWFESSSLDVKMQWPSSIWTMLWVSGEK